MKHEWLKEILGDSYNEEMDKKVAQKLGELFVARTDFNAVNEARKKLEASVNTSGEGADLQAKYDQLKEEHKCETQRLNKIINDNIKNNAVDMAIIKAKGKNPRAIRALVDMDKITVKETGKIDGLDLEAIKKTDGYLFDMETTQSFGTGFTKGIANKGSDMNTQIAKAMGIKTK